jgi:uncharacterized protein YjbI with pentapeptide repeats
MLEKDLRHSESDSEVRILAKARTLTVLGRLDPSRKQEVMVFLRESNLIQNYSADDDSKPIIALDGADLSGTDLTLPVGVLVGAKLSGADLSDANLALDLVFRADLSDANLSGANLYHAGLIEADLSGADLSDANLSKALLEGADLSSANLGGADLSGADLSDAGLGGADLTNANLINATGITNKELEQQASSLEGTTMPNGQKYAEWRKNGGLSWWQLGGPSEHAN